MKRNILITVGAVTLAAITINATAAEPLLSPRAAGNQIKHVSGIANDANLVGVNQGATVSPKAFGNRIVTVAGAANDVNPAIACAANMNGTPKMIQACVEHPGTMPGCNTMTVAPLK